MIANVVAPIMGPSSQAAGSADAPAEHQSVEVTVRVYQTGNGRWRWEIPDKARSTESYETSPEASAAMRELCPAWSFEEPAPEPR